MLNSIQYQVFSQKKKKTKGLVAYYKMRQNAHDFSGNEHHGESIGVHYDGVMGYFNGGYIRFNNSESFSFSDNVNDVPFSLAMGIFWDNKTGLQMLISKRTNNWHEWQFISNTDHNSLRFTMFNPTAPSNRIFIDIPHGLVDTGVLNTFYLYYDGSGNKNGFSAFLNGNNSVGVPVEQGNYTGMMKTTAPIFVGYNTALGSFFNGYMKDIAIWKNEPKLSGVEINELDYKIRNNIDII